MPTFTQAEYQEIIKRMGGIDIVEKPKLQVAKGRIPKPKMNQTESEYAGMLAERCQAGEILWWKFEAITLILKEFDIEEQEVRYTPDFDVMLANGELEFHESKGPFRWEDSWVKLKIAASLYPMRFIFAQRGKDKQWTIKAM